jgi:hypothetical protein
MVHILPAPTHIDADQMSPIRAADPLCISILSVGNKLALSVVTAGGSEAMFFKLNRLGKEAFLSRAVRAIEAFA